MSPVKRFGRSFVDKDPNRAEFDRDVEAALQDVQGVEVEITTPATANQEFTVAHKLRDRIPRVATVLRSDKGSVVYASRRTDWTVAKIFLKATVASDPILLWLR